MDRKIGKGFYIYNNVYINNLYNIMAINLIVRSIANLSLILLQESVRPSSPSTI